MSEPTDRETRQNLRTALAAFFPAAYMDNPEFHAAVHTLAELLPDMIEGLAVAALRRREAGARTALGDQKQQLERFLREHPPERFR